MSPTPIQDDEWPELQRRGMAAFAAGRLPEALDCIGRAIDRRGGSATLHNVFGAIWGASGEHHVAVAEFRKAIALDPGMAPAQANLTGTLRARSLPGAWKACRRLFALASGNDAVRAAALGNLASLKDVEGRHAEARRASRQALAIGPQSGDVWANLASALHHDADFAASLAASRRARAISPDLIDARWNEGVTLLLLGRLREGFAAWEWKWRRDRSSPIRVETEMPEWDGSPLAGRRILVYAEHGLGDTLHLGRLIPELVRRGGRPILACQPSLFQLLSQLDGIESFVPMDRLTRRADVKAPLIGLPRLLGIDLAKVPAHVPYLRPAADRLRVWRRRLGPEDGRTRIGIVWHGNLQSPAEQGRSLPVAAIAPLAKLSGLRLVSLQRDVDTALGDPRDLDLEMWGSEIRDFADSAAAMSLVDVVVACDTVAVHLAGALARPVYVLLRHVSEWRWLTDRSDSPWYPTARLFRQKRREDWSTAVADVAATLTRFAAAAAVAAPWFAERAFDLSLLS
jgi:Flp pilus assembly protein TadD